MKYIGILLKLLKYLVILFLGIVAILLIILFFPPIWRNVVTYPGMDKEVKEFNKLWQEPENLTSLNTFRGVMHLHSYWSHDSEGTLHDLIPAAKYAGIDFIFLTDHPRHFLDTFPRGYKGNYDGVLIEPGSERRGFAIWPMDSVVIDWRHENDTIARNIGSAGGLVFYAHPEEPRDWASPYYQGMEIYNFHADTKDEQLAPHIANFIVNGKKYRHWALREMFDEQVAILALWDSLNTHRKIVGYSAIDTHENQNIRARLLDDGRVEWVGPNAKPFDTVEITFRNRWLFNEPDENGWVFKFMLDTYKSGFNYITNYVLADTLTRSSLARHIKKGHLYTAFKSLGDAKGFIYFSRNSENGISAILGDSVQFNQASSLHAVSPLPGRFRLIHDGKTVDFTSGDNYEYTWNKPLQKGAYRIEVHINLKNNLIPWLYTNPIYIY